MSSISPTGSTPTTPRLIEDKPNEGKLDFSGIKMGIYSITARDVNGVLRKITLNFEPGKHDEDLVTGGMKYLYKMISKKLSPDQVDELMQKIQDGQFPTFYPIKDLNDKAPKDTEPEWQGIQILWPGDTPGSPPYAWAFSNEADIKDVIGTGLKIAYPETGVSLTDAIFRRFNSGVVESWSWKEPSTWKNRKIRLATGYVLQPQMFNDKKPKGFHAEKNPHVGKFRSTKVAAGTIKSTIGDTVLARIKYLVKYYKEKSDQAILTEVPRNNPASSTPTGATARSGAPVVAREMAIRELPDADEVVAPAVQHAADNTAGIAAALFPDGETPGSGDAQPFTAHTPPP